MLIARSTNRDIARFMTSAAGSTGTLSFGTLMGPMALALGLFSVLGAVAHRASRLERCDLNLPWSPSASEAWLASAFPTAWRDAQLLRQLSSDCVARLHSDIAVATLLVWLIAVLVTIRAFSKERIHSGAKLDLIKSSPYALATILFVGFLGSFWTLNYYFSSEILINFSKEYRRSTPKFDGHYVSPFFYCLNAFSLYVRSWILIFCVFGGIGLFRRMVPSRV
jgi:hypothetical protein